VLEQVVRELPDREHVDEIEEKLDRRHDALGPRAAAKPRSPPPRSYARAIEFPGREQR
jgi:hypothetical protein